METFNCRRRLNHSPSACTCPVYTPIEDDDNEDNQDCDTCDHPLEWHYAPIDLTYQQGTALKQQNKLPLERCKDPDFKDDKGNFISCPCPLFVEGGASKKECKLCGHKQGWHRWRDQPTVLRHQTPPPGHLPSAPPLSPSSNSSSGSYYSNSGYGSYSSYQPLPYPHHPPTPPAQRHFHFGSPPDQTVGSPSTWNTSPPSSTSPYPPYPPNSPNLLYYQQQQSLPQRSHTPSASTSAQTLPPQPSSNLPPRDEDIPDGRASEDYSPQRQEELEEIVLPGGYQPSPRNSSPSPFLPPTSPLPPLPSPSLLPPLPPPGLRSLQPLLIPEPSPTTRPVSVISTRTRLQGTLAPESEEFYAPIPVQPPRRGGSPGILLSSQLIAPPTPPLPLGGRGDVPYSTYTHNAQQQASSSRRTPVRNQTLPPLSSSASLSSSLPSGGFIMSPTAFPPGAVIPADRVGGGGGIRRRGTSVGVLEIARGGRVITGSVMSGRSNSNAAMDEHTTGEDNLPAQPQPQQAEEPPRENAPPSRSVPEPPQQEGVGDEDQEELEIMNPIFGTPGGAPLHHSTSLPPLHPHHQLQQQRSRGWSSGSVNTNSSATGNGGGVGGATTSSVGSSEGGLGWSYNSTPIAAANQVGQAGAGGINPSASTLTLPTTLPTKLWKEYETKTKSLTLSISPPLDSRKFNPGQVFNLKLSLGTKFSLNSWDRIEVRLIGNCYIHNEPPDNHNFLTITSSILPLSAEIEQSRGQRSFTWNMMLPYDQNCDCRNEPLPLPASYGHHVFYTSYCFKLSAKKHARFGLGNTEKIDAHFAVDAPFIEMNGLGLSPSTAGGLSLGTDGPWKTRSSNKLIRVEDQAAPIISSELAWQILHPPDTTVVHIPYRVSLDFGVVGPSQYFNENVLKKYSDTLRIALSRRITLSKSGKPSADGKFEERALPVLLVTFKDRRENSGMVIVDGNSVWRCEGYLEAEMREARSLSTCSAAVRYMITAKASANCGFSHPIELYARNVNIELPTSTPDPPPIRPDTTAYGVGYRRTSLLVEGFATNSGGMGTGLIASGSGLTRQQTQPLTPTPTQPQLQPQPFVLTPPPPPVTNINNDGRFQLQDGPRPPSVAGSSIYRMPLDQRSEFLGPARVSSDDGWSIDTPPTGPPTLPSIGSVSPAVEEPPTRPSRGEVPPPVRGRLDLPPDFDEWEPGQEEEPTPAYVPYAEDDESYQ